MNNIDILRNNEFFFGLEEKELIKLASRLRTKKVKKDTYLIQEHDYSTEMYLLLEGKVNVMLTNQNGKEMILATLQAGDIIGELSLLDDGPRSATILTEENCVVLVLNKADLFEFLNGNPKFAIQVIRYLCHRLRLTNKTTESFALLNAYERLKNYFESIAVVIDKNKWLITSHRNQDAIALQIGTSREMVSKIIKKLKDDHQCLTYTHNKIVLHKALPEKL